MRPLSPILERGSFALVVLALSTLAVVLAFRPGMQEWFLGRLGYGLVPTGLWMFAFLGVLRFRRDWLRRCRGVWLGSAFLVVATLGSLSFFSSTDGVLEEATLGGSWGQILGGSPLPLGMLKVAVTLLLVPLAVAPGLSFPWYRRAGAKAFALGRPILLSPYLVWYRGFRRARGRTVEDEGAAEDALLVEATLSRKLVRRVPGLPRLRKVAGMGMEVGVGSEGDGAYGGETPEQRIVKVSKWRLPSVDMLARGESHSVPQTVLDEMARRIETTLSEHGVEVSVEDIKPGPRVIRYGLVPGWVRRHREMRGSTSTEKDPSMLEMSRVKVHSIVARERDLALALKTPDIRIEAPVPGEALVGLEVPSSSPNMVYVRSLVETVTFRKIAGRGGLALAMGQGTGGEPVTEDLIELPHLLIAGATGSGKSVCVNSLITSLLMGNRPDRLRLLMIDPKRVELTPFNGLPHLLAPVVVDTEEVLRVLPAVLREMFRRYRMLEEAGVRNIDGYNRKTREPLPYLLLVIDELADLMMSAAYEMEQALVRLAQLGRATGIHLILCTQRPSVNVVTGLLKANIPSRVAFAVASQVDSRVILDGAGAEKLLGKGDMLFLSAQSPKPRRIQGTYVTDEEIDRVVQFWKRQKGPPLPQISLEDPDSGNEDEFDESEDDLLEEARQLAVRYNQLSPSLLQRRLQVGYPRALRLIDLLEEDGVIAGGAPGKSRAVLREREPPVF